MKYIREYHPQSKTAIVRSDTYAKSVEHVARMAQILIDDFGVSSADIRTVLYSGRFYAKTLGVEVRVIGNQIPASYREVSSLETYYG